MRLEPGAEHDVEFTDLMTNGQAVGRIAGMAVFCFGPLPGERARVRIATVKAKYAVAEVLRIVTQSPARARPFCPVFGACGGCQVQHLSYPAQLVWKRDVVKSALERIGGLRDAGVRETVGMTHPRDYRNKMALVVDRAPGGAPVLGFYRQRSHDVVPIDACPIVVPQASAYVAALRGADVAEGALKDARHVTVRCAQSTGEATVTIVSASESTAARRAAPALLERLAGATGIANAFDLSGENAVMGRRLRVLTGRGDVEEAIAGIRYRVSPRSFFQVNVAMIERIFATLRTLVRSEMQVVDLYCGAGTFALFFAAAGCRVYGIEENRFAVEEARANARLNGLRERTRFDAGRVEAALLADAGRAALTGADAVFLDPPRKGSDEATLAAVAAARVPAVWYLSCDPATLARDLKFLTAKGYALVVVQPFDMFPQTGHVETLAVLSRAPAD